MGVHSTQLAKLCCELADYITGTYYTTLHFANNISACGRKEESSFYLLGRCPANTL